MNVVHMNTITIFDLFINKKSIYLYYQLHTVGCIWWLNDPYRGNYLVTFFFNRIYRRIEHIPLKS